MWMFLPFLAVLLHPTVHSASLKCESTSNGHSEYIEYIACSIDSVTSSKHHVTVNSMNINLDELKKQNLTIYIDIVGHAEYPEYFPSNLGKIINGTGGFTYKNSPLKYIGRSDFTAMSPDLFLIILEDNKLEDIPYDTFYDLPDLMYLDVRNNHIKSLPATLFAYAPQFTTLIIESNEIKELHQDLFKDCPKFYVLYAEYNQINQFHADLFKNNPDIKIISMRHNRISNIPVNFNSYKHLDVADFTHNAGTCDTMYFSFMPYVEYYDENEQKKWIKTVPEFQKKIEEVCRS